MIPCLSTSTDPKRVARVCQHQLGCLQKGADAVCYKNYQNQLVLFKTTACEIWRVFIETQCIQCDVLLIHQQYLLPGVRWLSMPSSSSSKTAHSARETSDRFVLPIKFGVKPSFGFKIGIMLSLIQNPKDKVTLEFGLNWVKTSHFLRNWGVNPLLSRS